ncbi:choice-of-anchor D domain-containing protein [Tritonibacter mobilis]|uniref:DUF7933 domain-containing protein n=1 Tax=Tritonibacter mobilis TaxID=379347 RepID=UPI003A5BF0F8
MIEFLCECVVRDKRCAMTPPVSGYKTGRGPIVKRLSGVFFFIMVSLFVAPQAAQASFTSCPANTSGGDPLTMNLTVDECTLQSGAAVSALSDDLIQIQIAGGSSTNFFIFDPSANDLRDLIFSVNNGSPQGTLDADGGSLSGIDCAAGCTVSGTHGGSPFTFTYTASGGGGSLSSPAEIDDLVSSTGNTVADGGTDTIAAAIDSGTPTTITYDVSNSGSGTLSLSGLTQGTPTNASFGATSIDAASVASGGTETDAISITFTPSSTTDGASFSVPFSFTTNDADDGTDETTFNVTISGTINAEAEISDLTSSTTNTVADGGSDAQGTVASGSAQVLTYTITNSGTADLSVATASSSSASNVTVNSIGAPGSTTVSAGGGTTQFTVQYTPTAAGAFSFDLSFVNSDADEDPFNFTVSGTATAAPGFSQAIAPGTILADGTATVTFTIDNSANAAAATSLDFSNSLPAGVEVAATPNAATSCTGGTLTAVAGSGTLSYTGGTVGAGASCTVQADVTAGTDGSYSNTSGDLTSSLGNSGSASASLTVASPEIDLQRPAATSLADGDTDAQGNVAVGVQQVLTYTVENTGNATLTLSGTPSSSAASNVSVDSISAPGSSSLAANASTTFTVAYTPTAAGAFSFELDVSSDDADEGTYDLTVSGTATAAPGFSQSIAPGTILADGTATVTFTIDNSANAAAATSLDFSNSLPAGVEVAATPNAATSCTGGTLTAVAGSGTLSYTGGTVGAGASCTVQADVTAGTDGSYSNTSGDLTSSLGNSGSASASLTVASPEIDLQRPAATSLADGATDAQGNVAVGVQQVLTYTVENTGTATLTLSGTPSSSAASNVSVDSISAPGSSSLAASGSTTFTVAYTPTAAGAFSFELDVSNDDADEGTYDLTVSGTATAAPGFSQAIAPGTILADGTATVTFTIDNSANAAAATSLDFSNSLPAGVEVAATPNAATTCTGGTLTAVAGSGTLSYTGGTVGAGASCTVQADVTAGTDGSYSNTSGDLTSSLGNSGSASASLTVASPEIDLQRPAATSLADGDTDAQGNVAVGVQQVLTYTVENTGTTTLTLSGTPSSAAASNVSVDSISAPGSSSLAASASTTFTVAYTPTAAGAFSFELDVSSDDADEGTYDLTVSGTATAAPGFSQAIAPGTILADGTATVTFTIDNSANAAAATSLDFSNSLPAGVEVAATPNAATSCTGGTLTAVAGSGTLSYTGGTVGAGASCTVQADVTAGTDGSYSNTSGDLTSSLGNSGSASASLTVASPEIDLQRPAATSLADGDTDAQGNVAVGVQQVLTYTVENTGNATLTLSGTPSSSAASNVSVDSISAPGSSSLAASASTTFTVAYTPTAAGAFSFELDVSSDDADEGTYDLTISGTADGSAEIGVGSATGGSLEDGDTDTIPGTPSAGSPTVIIYTFTNSGSGTLNITTPTVAGNISNETNVVVNSLTLASNTVAGGGGTTTLEISYTPQVSGAYRFDLQVANDDADESLFNITVAGSASGDPEIEVSSSATGALSDGDTDSIATVATPGVATSVTYTITNSGTDVLTLDAPSVASNIRNQSNVTVDRLSLASTTVASGGGTTTLRVDYTVTAGGAYGFDLSLGSDDADEDPFDIVVSGTAQSVASALAAQSGSGQVSEVGAQFAAPLVVLVTDSTGTGVAGVDVTFAAPASGASVVFASTGTHTETVTTGSDGTASTSAMTANGTPSSYAGGSTLQSYDVTASATGLASVTFALTNDRDSEADIQKTQEVIAAFVSNRANAIVSNQPDLVSRLRQGALAGQQGRNGFDLRATSGGRSANFSFSLRALLEEARRRNDGARWRESLRHADASAGPGADSAADRAMASQAYALRFRGTDPAQAAPVVTPVISSGWDFWAEGTYAITESGNFESRSGLFFAGADYRWSDQVLLGVMGQLDITDEDNVAAGTSASGTGWMVGPYVVVRLDQNLYLDVAATYGRSSNTVNALGLFEDDFDTERFLLQGGLTGDFKLNARTTISPFARLTYYYEKQESYTDTLGRVIPSQDFELGRFEFGPKISWEMYLQEGTQFSPYVSFSGIYDFNKLQGATPTDATLASSQSDLRGRLEAGATFLVPDRGIKVAVEGFYDGIGTSDFESYGASLSVLIPF